MKRALILGLWALCCAPLAADEPTADDYFAFFKPALGDWTCTYRCGEKTAEGSYTSRLSTTGRCIEEAGTAILQYPAFQGLSGYDPVVKKWKSSAFNTAGEHWVSYVSTDAAALRREQVTFHWEATVAKPGGRIDVWRGDLTVTVGQDEWKQVFTNQTLNGEQHPDEETHYRRRNAGAHAATNPAPGADPARIFLERIAGQWHSTVAVGDFRAFGQMSALPADDKSAVLVRERISPLDQSATFTGLATMRRGDAPNSVRMTYAANNNDMFEDEFTLRAEGTVLTGKGTRKEVGADGKTTEGDLEVTSPDGERLLWRVTNRRAGEKLQPDVVLHFHRVQFDGRKR